MSEINSSNFKKEHGDLAPDLVGVTELTSPYFFVPPSGDTASRPEDCEPGTLRFNTDHGSLEVFRGKTIGWEQIQRRESQYLGGGTGSNTGTGTRVIQGGGQNPSNSNNVIQFFTLSTLGNAQDFGDLLDNGRSSRGAASSSTRGLFANFAELNAIQFVTISSLGNATDFGDTTYTGTYKCGLSSQTRAIFAGGRVNPATYKDDICYVTISQTGNAVDFGNLEAGNPFLASFASSTRGVIAGGYRSPGAITNIIQFVTISTTGNSTDFGDLLNPVYGAQGASNATRGIISGGDEGSPVGKTNVIQFVTIATTGNAVDFGDSTNKVHIAAGGASPTRAAFFGGYTGTGSPNTTNEINFVEIATTGNATDFGDLLSAMMYSTGFSNGHGGL